MKLKLLIKSLPNETILVVCVEMYVLYVCVVCVEMYVLKIFITSDICPFGLASLTDDP